MIIDQLQGYCDCAKPFDEKTVNEIVHVISMATGWARMECETFLMSERREVIDLPSCTDCPIKFEPYYKPFDPDSFNFQLLKVEGIDETKTEITEFRYHESDGLFYLNPQLPSCKCQKCTCGCPPTYKLKVEYTAGYNELPECLLPVFCNVLNVIQAKNDCDCNDCGCDTKEEVKYASGDVVSVSLETRIGQILVEQYMNQLGFLSLVKPRNPLWGFVV